jgi:hypothetical protein
MLTAAVVGAAVELLFRLALFPGWRDLHHDMYVPHPVFEHYSRPNLDIRRLNPGNWDVRVHTNARGMRGREADREAELAGLWVVGDSNAFGGYLDDGEVFAARLAGHGLRAANLSSEGHDLLRQSRVLRSLAAEGRRPRAVVAAVTLYHGIKPYRTDMAELDQPLPEVKASAPAGGAATALGRGIGRLLDSWPRDLFAVRVFLGSNSAAYGWLKSGIMGIPALREWTLARGLRADLDMIYPFGLDLLRPLTADNPRLDDVRATADLLARLSGLVRRDLGAPFAVVLLPAHHQIYPAAFARWRTANGFAGEDLDPLRPLAALQTELTARGVPTLATLDALRASPWRVTFPDDGHLNAAGHRIVAEALAGWLPGALGIEARP